MNDASTFVLPPAPPSPSPPPPAARHSRSRLVALVVGLLAIVAAAGVVLVRGGGRAEAVPLALSFTAGESETYTISQRVDADLSADGFGGEIPEGFDTMHLVIAASQTVTWEVLSVDDDGVATISVSTLDASASINGVEVPASDLAGPPIEMRVAPDGRILSLGDLSFAGLEQGGLPRQGGLPGMSQVTPILPEDGAPVAPGDTWETSYSQAFPFGDGEIAYDVHSTYLGNEEVRGVDAALIRSSMTVPLDLVVRFEDLAAFAEEQDLAPSASKEDLRELRDAAMTFDGRLEVDMTSFVDLEAQQLLRSESAGDFDVSVRFDGIPGFEGTMRFAGTFMQELDSR